MRLEAVLLATTLTVTSCLGNNNVNTKAKNADNLKKQAIIMEAQDTVGIKHLSPEQCLVRLGQPATDSTFTLGQPLTEFRISIYNHIPKANRYSSRIKIREMIWQLKNKERLCVWYIYQNKKWIYLEKLTFAESAIF